MERRTAFRRTTRITLGSAAILLGLGCARLLPEISGWWPIILLVWVVVTFKQARILSLYLVIIFGFTFGWWRGAGFMQRVDYVKNLDGQKIAVVGKVLTDGIYDEKSSLTFDIGSAQQVAPENSQLAGKISVSGYGAKMVYRGDEVLVKGKFYDGRGSVVGYMNYAETEVLAESQSIVYKTTREFSAGMLTALPEPQASFGLGLLIGQRDTLPEQTSNILAAVGLTHIIAVSGYNLTILVRANRRLLAKRSKFQAMIGSVVLILLFLMVTGGAPSIVRASIISLLALGAWYYGRNIKPMLILLVTAAATALWNPLYIWSDIGWYLSFLAFFGVLIVAPLAKAYIFNNRKFGIMGEVVLESLAAQVMALPLILYIFNESSYVVLLANLLVVPLIPVAMLFSFVAGMAGMLVPAISGWFAWPAKWILTYLLDVATLVSRIPNMQFSVQISTATMVTSYGFVIMCAWIWWQKLRKNDKITEIKNHIE